MKEVTLSTGSIVKFFLVLLALLGLFLVREILIVLFVSFLLAAGFNPIIERFGRRMPRMLAVTIFYLGILAIFVAIGFLVKTPIVTEGAKFQQELVSNGFRLSLWGFEINGSQIYGYIQEQFTHIRFGQFIETTGRFLDVLVGVITTLVISFYLLLDKEAVEKMLATFLPSRLFNQSLGIVKAVELKLGLWLRGQLTLMLIVGTVTTIGLLIIGVPYAVTLGIIAGLTEAIPSIGPLVGGLFAILVTAGSSPDKILFVVILYALVQWVENNFVVPLVMKKAVGLSPVVVIVSFLVGAKLMGPLGAVLSVPAVAAITAIISEVSRVNKLKKE